MCFIILMSSNKSQDFEKNLIQPVSIDKVRLTEGGQSSTYYGSSDSEVLTRPNNCSISSKESKVHEISPSFKMNHINLKPGIVFIIIEGLKKCIRKPTCQTRVLRSSVIGTNQPYDKKRKCHICRERVNNYRLRRCENYTTCHGAFCIICLDRYFKERFRKEKLRDICGTWICFLCRGICKCQRCKNSLEKELLELTTTNDEPGTLPKHNRFTIKF